MKTEKDNWKHRSDGMRCKTCMFYVPKGDGGIGRCRKKAPTLDGWPAVFPTDWCGDHKIDEDKIALTTIESVPYERCAICLSKIEDGGKCKNKNCASNHSPARGDRSQGS